MFMEKKIKRNVHYLHINFLEKYAEPLGDVLVSHRLVKLFTIFHFAFALDYGFVECENVVICFCLRIFPLIKAFCITFATGYMMVFIDTNIFYNIFNSVLLAKYFLTAFILFCHRHKMSLKSFQKELLKIDKSMGISIRSDTKFIFSVILSVSAALGHFFLCVGLYRDFTLFSICFYCLPTMSNSIPTCVMYFVFYDICLRLKHVEYKIINDKNVDIMFYQRIYKRLGDIVDFFNETINWMYGFVLLFGIPNMLVTVYYVVFVALNEWGFSVIIEVVIYMTLVSAYTYAPAFAAGMLTSQAEKIPVALHNKLLSEQPDIDDYRKSDIEAFIMYANIRPFKYCVMKVVPLGWSLPLVVLNIVITYTIVIMQFSHIV